MSLIDLLPNSPLGWRGSQPPVFDMGANSKLHNVSSIVNSPDFATYQDPYLKTKKPSDLDRGNSRLPHYMDNPPR